MDEINDILLRYVPKRLIYCLFLDILLHFFALPHYYVMKAEVYRAISGN